jgi:hypothetical protein
VLYLFDVDDAAVDPNRFVKHSIQGRAMCFDEIEAQDPPAVAVGHQILCRYIEELIANISQNAGIREDLVQHPKCRVGSTTKHRKRSCHLHLGGFTRGETMAFVGFVHLRYHWESLKMTAGFEISLKGIDDAPARPKRFTCGERRERAI